MDFAQAKKIFAGYLKQYDTKNDKIRLKIVHTYGVVDAARLIAEGLGLSGEDTALALHIALLHDIGRFEQLKRYDSFDDSIVPHADLSLSILFDENLIRSFIPERDYDSVIYTAIKNHGVYLMDDSLTGRDRLHSMIIRDADKLDNFRVKEQDSIPAMLDIEAEELGAEDISDHILTSFLNRRPIKNSDRVTHMDMWISYLGYIYDLNFPESRRRTRRHRYAHRPCPLQQRGHPAEDGADPSGGLELFIRIHCRGQPFSLSEIRTDRL